MESRFMAAFIEKYLQNERMVQSMKHKQAVIGMLCGTLLFGMTAGTAAAESSTKDSLLEGLPESSLVRNENGDVTGVDRTYEQYEEDEVKFENVTIQELLESSPFEEYEELGLSYDSEDGKLYYAGMEVWALDDEYRKNTILSYTDEILPLMTEEEKETISLSAVRDEDYNLLYFDFLRYQSGPDPFDADSFDAMEDIYDEEELTEEAFIEEEEPYEDQKTEDTGLSLSIIGGADGPTSIFVAGIVKN